MEKIKWYIVYRELANLLNDFYTNCINSNKQPGIELYNMFRKSSEFKKSHTWFKKFENNTDINSIDPIHFFSSFNSNKSSYDSRKIRILALLELLESDLKFSSIDFDGCPAPYIINLLSNRNSKSQEEIWDLFHRIMSNKRNGLKETDFDNYKNWYGVEFGSLTIFLFWIQSDNFLPLDRNTSTFLVATKFLPNAPKTFFEYANCLEKLDVYNNNYLDEQYGEQGLFREVAYVSYRVISLNIKDVVYTAVFSQALSSISIANPIEPSTELMSEKINDDENINNATILLGIGFKIIAIKPLGNCNAEYLNVLKKDRVYYFENLFEIKGEKVNFNQSEYLALYNNDNLKFNVTAVVGKNGSGKSSLVELFYRLVNNIAYKFQESFSTTQIVEEPSLEMNLYYLASGVFYCVSIIASEIKIQKYKFTGKEFVKDGELRDFLFQDFEIFFYTVSVNYSHYALNSITIGKWIKELFHKNDAYQTPIVINPMRTNGNIDINRENGLVKSRLLSLLFGKVEEDEFGHSIRQLTEKQIAIKVEFERDLDKNKILFTRINKDNEEQDILFEQLKTKQESIINALCKVFKLDKSIFNHKTKTEEETIKYIIRKLVRISLTYGHYSTFFLPEKISFEVNDLEEYFTLLLDDDSHITYKLRQAINYLKYPDLYSREDKFILEIESFSFTVDTFISKHQELTLIELIPPPIFKISIKLKNENGVISDFEKLSSGEKQLIHSVTSILYHLTNLNSVKRKNSKMVSYKNIYLLLDEIELYYHPDLQRKYLDYLLNIISRLPLNNILAINICLVTHSPYILSDIPSSNILKLDDGKPSKFIKNEQTFGANIHDLLANDFFMNDGFMGEFAKKKINEIISYLDSIINDKEVSTSDYSISLDKEFIKQFIDNIGEPLIKDSLTELYFEAFLKTEYEIDQEIDNLNALKAKIKNK